MSVTEHAGPDGSDPYAHDSEGKRNLSKDTPRKQCLEQETYMNSSQGAECHMYALTAGRCGAWLKHLDYCHDGEQYCTVYPILRFVDSIEHEYCCNHAHLMNSK